MVGGRRYPIRHNASKSPPGSLCNTHLPDAPDAWRRFLFLLADRRRGVIEAKNVTVKKVILNPGTASALGLRFPPELLQMEAAAAEPAPQAEDA